MIERPTVQMVLVTEPGEVDPETGEPTTVQRFVPHISIACVVSEGPVTHRETLAGNLRVHQFTGVYGDARSLLDLTPEEMLTVMSVWEANVRANLTAALAQPEHADLLTKAAQLESLFEVAQ